MSPEIKLLVVDDSAVTRQLISRIVEQDKYIRIVGRARNGQEALDRIAGLKPDVVTLDVEMPVMDGLETLSRIMQVYPVPVVMLSSLTHKGALATVRALELGAVDFLPKPENPEQTEQLFFDLPAKIKLAAAVPIAKSRSVVAKSPVAVGAAMRRISPGEFDLVVLGISTGGPSTLQKVIPRLPADLPAGMIIIQHMPKGFTRALAERLNQSSGIAVREAQDGDLIKTGLVLVAPAGQQLYLKKDSQGVRVDLRKEANVSTLFSPSVDVTMLSAAAVYGKRVLGVIMTGMGNDGVRGLQEIKNKGGSTIAESEESSVVFGMPRAAINAGVVDEIHHGDNMAEAIIRAVNK